MVEAKGRYQAKDERETKHDEYLGACLMTYGVSVNQRKDALYGRHL